MKESEAVRVYWLSRFVLTVSTQGRCLSRPVVYPESELTLVDESPRAKICFADKANPSKNRD